MEATTLKEIQRRILRKDVLSNEATNEIRKMLESPVSGRFQDFDDVCFKASRIDVRGEDFPEEQFQNENTESGDEAQSSLILLHTDIIQVNTDSSESIFDNEKDDPALDIQKNESENDEIGSTVSIVEVVVFKFLMAFAHLIPPCVL